MAEIPTTQVVTNTGSSFSINNFRSQLVGDGARPNLFEVSMSFPSFVQANGNANASTASTKLTFMCKAAQMPSSTMGVVVAHYFGRESKHAGNRTFAEWTVTIINDEDFAVRGALENWSNALNSHKANLRDSQALAPSSYCVDASIVHYGKTGNKLRTYNMIGAFPSDISAIDLDWGTMDTIEEYTCTFAYQWWEVAGITS